MTISRRKFMVGAGVGAVAAPGVASLLSGPHGVQADSKRDPSLWTTEVEGLPKQPEFKGERKVDLAIVGGGYTGLSCAYYAKKFRPDWSVVVLESHTIGSGASSRNTGAVYAKIVGVDDHKAADRGLARIRSFIDSEEVDCDFAPASTLTVLPSEGAVEGAKDNMQPGAKWVSAEELKERGGTSFYAGAVDEPGFYKIQPAKLLVGMAEAALKQGVELYENSPVMDVRSGKPAILKTPVGDITADNVMIATNGYTPRLGIADYKMYPLHQYSFATRKLSAGEISALGLDVWDLRFEPQILPMTFSLTPSGRFFVRLVLGYASHNSTDWPDISGAKEYTRKVFENRYPQLKDIGLEFGWHGVTGHTTLMKHIAGPINSDGNIHISAAYNGLGIMPSHNNGYLTAARMAGQEDQDFGLLNGVSGQLLMPGDYYRSLILKPGMSLLAPS